MFRAILQKSERVLRGLVGSLLHLSQDEIQSVEITNPIRLGEQIDNKTFVMDINLRLNDDTNINLELQVLNQGNWTDRSLSYLCRAYDQLYQGEEYTSTCRAVQIGILDYSLFPDKPEFLAEYRMMNVKNHRIYSDKLRLLVLELRQDQIATEEDRQYGIDQWARLFKSTTWEEIHMTGIWENEFLSEAAAAMYEMNADDIIRQQCRAREEYIRHENYVKQKLEALEQENAEQKEALEAKEHVLAEQKEALEAKEHALTEKESVIAGQKAALTEKDSKLEQYQKRIQELEAQLTRNKTK